LETKGSESKWKELIKNLPNWGALIISIGGIVFSCGVMWNNVSSMNDRMDKQEQANLQMLKLSGDVNLLHYQLEQANKVQDRTNTSVDNLTGAVNDLGESVSNLEGKLSIIPDRRNQKRR
jgi:hypothetical protein